MQLRYNAPLSLTFSLLAALILALRHVLGPGFMDQYFTLWPDFDIHHPVSYFRLVSYTLGHFDRNHLLGNLSFLLLLGPILEERYGALHLFGMMLFTALSTAVVNLLFFGQAIMGASGIVFMFIVLVSFVNVRRGTIPLTFVLVFGLYMWQEISASFEDDQVSQLAHIVGGACGAMFGFRQHDGPEEEDDEAPSGEEIPPYEHPYPGLGDENTTSQS